MNENYDSRTRQEAYETELNRILAQSGPVREFTDEENLYMARQRSEGIEEFLLAQKKRDLESALEMKNTIINA